MFITVVLISLAYLIVCKVHSYSVGASYIS